MDQPVGAALSLQLTTSRLTNRYLRHQYGLARTDVVDANSSELLRQDATFVVAAA
ncbi:MAG: AbfB domain-containing protein [Bryobacteraceae bacterium]